jgi:subtilisin family serine protease
MRRDKRRALAILACCLLAALRANPAPSPPGAETETRIIVVLDRTEEHALHASWAEVLVDEFAVLGLLQLEPLGVDGPLPGTPAYLGVVACGADTDRLIGRLGRSPSVLRVERDMERRFLAIDPLIGPLDEEFQNGKQEYYRDIGVVKMWSRAFTGITATNPITVAVIDSGVDLDHPDIDDNLVRGYDFVDSDDLPQDGSPDSHGSMVCGIAGAEINNDLSGGVGRGVAGIGGGDALSGTLGLRIMPLRIDAASCAQSAQAIDYARTHGAQVINMSYGGDDACQLELDALQRAYDAGIALVAGAGNDNVSTPFYPAAYGAGTDELFVIAVAGVNADRTKGATSNYGAWIDVCAPYDQIRSLTRYGSYSTNTGTSFSAPLVSGLVGILVSNYGWSRDAALSVVLTTADDVDDVNPSYQGLLGSGRINADRATSLNQRVYLPLAVKGH